jgi:hypothetical protein
MRGGKGDMLARRYVDAIWALALSDELVQHTSKQTPNLQTYPID